MLRGFILPQPCQCSDGRSTAQSVCKRHHRVERMHMTGSCKSDLDGGGLQNLERLGAGHNAAEAMLAILLEGEALLPRQPAQVAAPSAGGVPSVLHPACYCERTPHPVMPTRIAIHMTWRNAQRYSAPSHTALVVPVAAVICTMMQQMVHKAQAPPCTLFSLLFGVAGPNELGGMRKCWIGRVYFSLSQHGHHLWQPMHCCHSLKACSRASCQHPVLIVSLS